MPGMLSTVEICWWKNTKHP